MKQFSFSNTAFETLQKIDLSEMGNQILLDCETRTAKTDNLRLLLILLNEEIASAGMTNDQQNVNEYGRALYNHYDELYTQK